LKKKYLGVIPARGGSKGVLRKNIKSIAGLPLIAWTIRSALESELLSDLIVSTEDEEIAEISEAHGCRVLWRPSELATDEATCISVLQHVIEEIPFENLVLLQATSPIRKPGLVDTCIEEFEKSGADNLGTGWMCDLKEYGSYKARRQELESFFHDDGNIYVVKEALIRAGKMYGDKVERLVISREENVEIDDEFDFWLAEQILLKRKP
jgi:CMP-N,N'-diacetyllegionaminic acid synthase